MTVNNGKSFVQCPIHHIIILIMSVPIIQVFCYNNNLLTFILLLLYYRAYIRVHCTALDIIIRACIIRISH